MFSATFNFKLLLFSLSFVSFIQLHDCTTKVIDKPPTFEVDYNNSQFLMNGKPFKYASGEMHYFRIPRAYWKDRLHKVRAAGFNAIQTYIEWSQHEVSHGQYNFSGELDFEHYIRLAQEEGLYVILRPGPYICAERDFGGFPSWLLTVNPNMKFRTSDPSYTFFVEKWFSQLMPRVQPLLFGNGGPIIMVQVENEYGSYPINDQKYKLWLRDLYSSYVGSAAVLFTTDGPSYGYVSKGHIPGVLSTIDFGIGYTNLTATYADLKKIQPNGPLVNSEYYSGWLQYWGEAFPRIPVKPFTTLLRSMLENNISVNAYMVHGGTNFGFTAGSGSADYFQPDLTTYDYDAPISEAGDLTEKYFAIRDVLKDFFPVLNISNVPAPKGDYGKVTLSPVVSLFESPSKKESVKTEYPISFEELGQRYGFVAYHTRIGNITIRDPSVLQVTVRDRAIVYLNNVPVSSLQYTVINQTPLPTTFTKGQKLTLLIENLGRRNFQKLSDCTKGLISNATINGEVLKFWEVEGYPLNPEDIVAVQNLDVNPKNVSFPAFFTAKFQLPEGEEPRDTFLDMSNWGKGVAFVNEFNLGRYWHIGPQVTLYTPGCYLRPYPAFNTITLMELHYAPSDNSITFRPNPILDKDIA